MRFLQEIIENSEFQKLFKGGSILLVGSVSASIFGLIALSITAHSIGSLGLGILVTIVTYVAVVDVLINFQSWQGIIKYGTDLLKKNNNKDFRSLVCFGFLIDVVTAILALIIAYYGVFLAKDWFDFNSDNTQLLSIYVFVLILHISGTPTAILRIFERFDILAKINFISATIKLLFCLIAAYKEEKIENFLIGWALSDITFNLLIIIFSIFELKKRNLLPEYLIFGEFKKFIGIWEFLITTNLNSTIKMITREADILLAGIILGPNSVGLLKVAKQISSVAAILVDPLYQAIYPQIAGLYTSGKKESVYRLCFNSSFIVFIFTLIYFFLLWLSLDWLIEIGFGSEFKNVYFPTLLLCVGVTLAIITFPLAPLILVIGKPRDLTKNLAISTIIYLPFLWYFTKNFGIYGSGISYILFYICWISLTFLQILNYNMKKKKD